MPDENEGQPTGLSQRGGSVSALRRALLNSTQETVVEMLLEAYEQIDALRPDKARLDFADVHAYWDDGECGWTIHRPERGDIRTCIDTMMDRARSETLDQLAAETQRLGLYDSPNPKLGDAERSP